MRLLVHRGQALLLLVVVGLAVAALAGVVLERDGVPVLAVLRVNEVFAPPRPELPTRIVIGDVAPASERPPSPSTAATATATTVVPGAVYSYPPDDHGGVGRGSGHGGRE